MGPEDLGRDYSPVVMDTFGPDPHAPRRTEQVVAGRLHVPSPLTYTHGVVERPEGLRQVLWIGVGDACARRIATWPRPSCGAEDWPGSGMRLFF